MVIVAYFQQIANPKPKNNKQNMANWFECKVKYEKTLDTGVIKTVTEPYLVDALSFTEAENRFIEQLKPYISGEFSVTDIKRAKIAEMFDSEMDSDDRWYKAKVAFVTMDEKKGVEKRSYQTMLVKAGTLRGALKNLEDGMKGTMSDWEVVSLADTPILDVFHYDYGAAKE